MTVIKNVKNELIPTRILMRWRMCIDYCKLNQATSKDHFRFPFMDQMLEHLVGQAFYSFLYGCFEYNQIVVYAQRPREDNFHLSFGVYAYRRMPFGLCNTLTTLQRCMLFHFFQFGWEVYWIFCRWIFNFWSIFWFMLEQSWYCVKKVCIVTNIILNWEKYHFMVQDGIVIGHKIS